MEAMPGLRSFHHLENEHGLILRQVEIFEEALSRLHYEGKPRLGENLKRLNRVLTFFESHLPKVFKIEGGVFFPFVRRHVPKLEAATRMLEEDHRRIRGQLKTFEAWLGRYQKACQKGSEGYPARRLRETGAYLACFLKTHLEAEKATVCRTVHAELYPEEKALLRSQMKEGQKNASIPRGRLRK